MTENMENVDIVHLGIDLNEIIAGVEDVTNPSAMNKIMEYVEKIRDEDDTFMELLTQKCNDKVIYWERPWYQVQYPNIHQHKSSIVPERNETTITYRTDTICLQEHKLIKNNWRRFIKKFKLPDKLISFARWKNYKRTVNTISPVEMARRYTVAYLARGLQRTYSQVFYHVCKNIGGYRKGPYTEIEDKIIEIIFHHKPELMSSTLCLILGRQMRGILKKLSYMNKDKPPKKRLKWTLPLASKLVNRLLEYTQVELEDLKNRHIDPSIWSKLENEFDQSYGYLHRFWYSSLHVQLFVKSDVKLRKLRKKLFKKLRDNARDSTYKVWSDIRWKELVLDFPDGFTYRFLYLIGNIFIRNLKGYTKMPVIDVAEHALKKIKQQKGKKRNKRLRRLKLNKEGQLERVDYRN